MVKTLDISIENDDGVLTRVQVRDYIDSETYWRYLAISPKKTVDPTKEADLEKLTPEFTLQNQKAQYLLILATVVNPKLTDDRLRKMEFSQQLKLFGEINALFFGSSEEDSDFLEQSEPQVGSPQGS